MAKYINRLASRLAREKLRESKSWIVTKKLILETDEGDMEFEKGDVVDLGATPEGDLAVKGNAAAVIVVSDADLASKIADIVVSSDELSDVEFVDKSAVDTVLDGEEVDDVIGKLADEEPETTDVEVAQVDVDSKESVDAKFAKFASNPMTFAKSYVCESILVDETDNAPINLACVKVNKIVKESVGSYEQFVARVSELKGSIQPGAREIALSEAGEVIGAFDKEDNKGMIYPEMSFNSVEDMDAVQDEPEALVSDIDFELEDIDDDKMEAVEATLKAFEESAKSGKDYITMVESLAGEKIGMKESVVAKVAGSFVDNSLKEGCRVFDTVLGKNVRTFKESVTADNFIEETEVKGRFTKRFFA